MAKKNKVVTTANKKMDFIDTTVRDGAQSLWAMKMTYGMMDQVLGLIDQGGFDYMDIPAHAVWCKTAIRFWKEDPWPTFHLYRDKLKNTKKMVPIHNHVDMLGDPEPRSVIWFWHDLLIRTVQPYLLYSLANTRNELDRHYPWIIPMIRKFGLPFMSVICYYPCPRTPDEYYANLTKKIVTEYKPEYIWLKDAGGLFTVDRIRTLLPAMQKEAKGTPIHIHTHGMSTNSGRVLAEAMKLGVNGAHTCIPPLALGSSHESIFNTANNARILGRETAINEEPLREVERRLRMIAREEGLPVGVPLEYDEGVYTHQLPGGVISNLREQLRQLGMPDKLDEVLNEVKQIIVDLGYPMMITPFSQYMVSQAAVNVSIGERYKVILDPITEMALGVHGWEDIGVPWMDPNIRDMLINSPNAKLLKERFEQREAIEAEEGSLDKIRASYGMTHASDVDFMMYHIMKGDTEIKQVQPPKTYYTGKEPLVTMLKEVSKDHSISRLHMQRGNSFFDFRQK